LGLAILGGLVAGLVCQLSYFEPPKHLFDDTEHWHEVEPPTDDDLHFADKHKLHHGERTPQSDEKVQEEKQ